MTTETTGLQDYTASITVNAIALDAFNAINNVRGWWSEEMDGQLENINDVFTVHFGDVYITSKVVESIPGKKITWLVTDCNKYWLKDPKEWVGTQMNWELCENDGQTQISFTHFGLVPEVECYTVCSDAWGQYIRQSVMGLITTGKGEPTAKKA